MARSSAHPFDALINHAAGIIAARLNGVVAALQ